MMSLGGFVGSISQGWERVCQAGHVGGSRHLLPRRTLGLMTDDLFGSRSEDAHGFVARANHTRLLHGELLRSKC